MVDDFDKKKFGKRLRQLGCLEIYLKTNYVTSLI